MKGYIYKITNPSGKIYIGQSVNPKNRFSSYKRLACKKQIKLYNSLVKYGYENHNIEIIDECLLNGSNINLINELEIFWIKEYDSMCSGLNCTIGGKNVQRGETHYNFGKISKLKNIPRTQEVKDKMSKSMKGKIVTEETRNKISNTLKGRTGIIHTQETRDKISKSSKGKIITQEVREKLSNALKGRPSNKRCKINAYIYLTGEYAGTYESYLDCAEKLNICDSHIGCVIKGKRKQVGGYTFRYYTEQ